jgi:hypothetical protein
LRAGARRPGPGELGDGDEFTLAEIPVGSTLPFEPGESRVVVLSGALKPGRYVMSCFVADADAADVTLHLGRGTFGEFRVEWAASRPLYCR